MSGQFHCNPPRDPNEEPPIGRPCATDTPPITATQADDGSDFYNTPWAATTPLNNDEHNADTTPSHVHGPASSLKPAAQIPGLSLLNDGLNTSQPMNLEPIQCESTKSQNANNNPNVGVQHTAPNNGSEALEHEELKPDPAAGDAMEVEEHHEQHTQEEAGNQAQRVNVDNANEPNITPAEMSTDLPQEAEQADEPREWETDSSPYESSSDTSTTDSDDDSDEDDDYLMLSPEEQARILMKAENDSDDEGVKGKPSSRVKSTNELPDEAPPMPDITITPNMKIVHLGHVQTIVENALLIEASVSGEYQVLESGSLLCTEKREVVGVVSETLGRVERPLYVALYPSAAIIEERGLFKGKDIYYVEPHSTFVFTQPLKGMKGSDASNFHDEEVGEDEVEFSDDEAEAEHKRKIKQRRQERKNLRNENGSARARRDPHGPSKLSQSELSYCDDAVDDGYTPLARPTNLHEMMGNQEAPVETDGPPGRPGGFRGKGRGRGFGRGGGRGRGRGPGEYRPHYDGRPYRQETAPAHPSPQHPNYSQPAYEQNEQNAYDMPQLSHYAQFMQQNPQPYAQGSSPLPQFPFPMSNPQAYQQPSQFQQMSPDMHINPSFFAALQQHQQQVQQILQQPQQPSQLQRGPAARQTQSQTTDFDPFKAQLDILRQLSNGNQGPRPT